jgi:hypothetical protein
MGHYFSYEEDEANKQGHNDERNHRSDYTHSKYAYDGEDRAYWDGRKDEQENERRREEEREEEERQEREEQERYERQRRERAEREREQEEDYQRQRYEDDMRERDAEQQFENDCATEEYLNELPKTEDELFNQTKNNERGNQETEPNSD